MVVTRRNARPTHAAFTRAGDTPAGSAATRPDLRAAFRAGRTTAAPPTSWLAVHRHCQGREPPVRPAQRRDCLALHPQPATHSPGVPRDSCLPKFGTATGSGHQGPVTTGQGIADPTGWLTTTAS